MTWKKGRYVKVGMAPGMLRSQPECDQSGRDVQGTESAPNRTQHRMGCQLRSIANKRVQLGAAPYNKYDGH
jgi:hypothetical protein